MKKTAGILLLLIAICAITAALNPNFLSPYNLQNLIRWTALFGLLSIGAAFVIISGGIDLSIGSVVGLVGCMLPWLLTEMGWSVWIALPTTIGVAALAGLLHGLIITRFRIPPFLVTLCGLLVYRSLARYLTADQTIGFGGEHDTLRTLATGRPCSATVFAMVLGAIWLAISATRKNKQAMLAGVITVLVSGWVWVAEPEPLSELSIPTPFLIMVGISLLASGFLRGTIWGRYLFAIGHSETAARYSGVDTDRITMLAYVLCSTLAGIAGVLFALDINSIQPSSHGNFFELYAIAGAVLGGCSLRGGEGTVLGVILGAAVMRVLYNAITLLQIPTQLEMLIIGLVILIGVMADEIVRRIRGGPTG